MSSGIGTMTPLSGVENLAASMSTTTITQQKYGQTAAARYPNEPPKELPRKMAKGQLGVPVLVTTNTYEVNTDKVATSPFYRYELDLEECHKNGTCKDLTTGAKNDSAFNRKRRMCYMAVYALVQVEKGFFKNWLNLVYDRSRTFYTTEKLAMNDGETKSFAVTLEEMLAASEGMWKTIDLMRQDLDIRAHVEKCVSRGLLSKLARQRKHQYG